MLVFVAGGNLIHPIPCRLLSPRPPRAQALSLAALAFALLTVLSPTPSLAQPQPSPLAQREGKVVVYNGTSFRVVRMLGDLFAKETGIAVDVLDGRASEIRERIRTEQAAGRAIGDLIYSGSTSIALQTAEGAFAPLGD